MTPGTMKRGGGAATVNNIMLSVIAALLGIIGWFSKQTYTTFVELGHTVELYVKQSERSSARIDYLERDRDRIFRWAEEHGDQQGDPFLPTD